MVVKAIFFARGRQKMWELLLFFFDLKIFLLKKFFRKIRRHLYVHKWLYFRGLKKKNLFLAKKGVKRGVVSRCGNLGDSFKFQLCNHTSPGTQTLWFPGSFLRSLQKKRPQIASWHRLWLKLGRYLIAFEPLTFVLD